MFDATGINVEDISVDNPGELLAERVSIVAEKVEETLGYQAPQFRQVVLLPQGQFRELLTAKSDKRSEIMRKLFDVSLYEQLVEELKLEERALDAEVREGRQSIGNLLSQHGVTDRAALGDFIEAQQLAVANAANERERLNLAHTVARDALSLGNADAQKFSEQLVASTAVQALLARQPAIKVLELRHARSGQARSIVPIDNKCTETKLVLKTVLASLEAARSTKATADLNLKNAAAALKASVEREPERDALNREVTRLEEIEKRVLKAVPIRQETERLRTTADSMKAAFVLAEKAVKAAEQALSEARKGEVAAQKRQTKLVEVAASVKEFSRQCDEVKKHALAAAEVGKRKKQLSDALIAWDAEKASLALVESSYLKAEAALAKVQAVHLASKLVDGEPCSVCGSDHHPRPAKGNAESRGLNAKFDEAKNARQLAGGKERNAQSKHVEATALLKAAEKSLRGITAPKTTAGKADANLAAARAELDALKAQPSVEIAAAQASQADAKLTQCKSTLERTRASKDSSASALLTCSQKLASAFDGIEPRFSDPAVIGAALKAARTASSTAMLRHQAVIGTEREAEKSAVASRTAFDAQTANHKSAEAAASESQKSFIKSLEALGWTATEYSAAKGDIEQQPTLSSAIQAFHAEFRSASDRATRATDAIKDLVKPDLANLTATAQGAEMSAKQAQDHHGQMIAGLSQAEQTDKRCAELSVGIQASETRYSVIRELKDLTSGSNAIRMSLVDYAIAATFEDVLEAANIRFTRMSRGRFVLLRRSEIKDGRSRSGLEIVVHDSHTDRPRDAYTLSGGEGFMAALSLALGLSDVVQQRAGGIKLDVIFIDEGFGSLDEQTLDNALSTLRDLVGNNRAVGVISHLEAVKQQIQHGFDITKGPRGSRVSIRAPGH